jgi:HEAT repeat protein
MPHYIAAASHLEDSNVCNWPLTRSEGIVTIGGFIDLIVLAFHSTSSYAATVQKRVVIAVAVLLVASLSVILRLGMKWREPTYQGESLSSWLQCYSNTVLDLSDLRLVQDPSSKRANEAIRAIGSVAVPFLLRRLQAQDPGFWTKLRDLSEHYSVPGIRLTSSDVLNEQAANGLFALGDRAKDAMPQLIEMWDRPAPVWAQYAANTIPVAIGPAAVPYLLPKLRDPNVHLRLQAAAVLAKIDTDPRLAVATLQDCLNSPMWSIRESAAFILGQFGYSARSAVPALVRELSEPIHGLLATTVAALYQIDPGTAIRDGVPILINVLRTNASWMDREHAAKVLGTMGTNAYPAVPALVKSLREPELCGRPVLEALQKIEPTAVAKEGVPALIGALSSDTPIYSGRREAAAEILGDLGPNARQAVPALVVASCGANRRLRFAATEALRKIDPNRAASEEVPK